MPTQEDAEWAARAERAEAQVTAKMPTQEDSEWAARAQKAELQVIKLKDELRSIKKCQKNPKTEVDRTRNKLFDQEDK